MVSVFANAYHKDRLLDLSSNQFKVSNSILTSDYIATIVRLIIYFCNGIGQHATRSRPKFDLGK